MPSDGEDPTDGAATQDSSDRGFHRAAAGCSQANQNSTSSTEVIPNGAGEACLAAWRLDEESFFHKALFVPALHNPPCYSTVWPQWLVSIPGCNNGSSGGWSKCHAVSPCMRPRKQWHETVRVLQGCESRCKPPAPSSKQRFSPPITARLAWAGPERRLPEVSGKHSLS